MTGRRLARHAGAPHAGAALACVGETVSYLHLDEELDAWSRCLAGWGVTPGTTVGVQVLPSFTYVYLVLALWDLGARIVLLDYRLKSEEVERYSAGLGIGLWLRSASSKRATMGHFDAQSQVTIQPVSPAPACSLRAGLVQFTSGTGGRPKAIERSRSSVLRELHRWASLEGAFGVGDRVLLLSSPVHSFGLVGGILQTLAAGATVMFADSSQAADIRAAITELRPTVILGVPFHYRLLPAIGLDDLGPLRIAICGGEILPADTYSRVRQRFGLEIGQSYGMTEVGVIAADLTGRLYPGVGRPGRGLDVAIREGEVYVRLQHTPYLSHEPGRFHDGWLRTFDRGEIQQPEGALHIKGRGDSLVSVGGLKVDLTEVENTLVQHPGVRGAVVLQGDHIEAYVESEESLDESALIRWCRKRLADYKLPRLVHVMPTLPRTATGKVVRRREALQRRIQESQRLCAGVHR